jgi:hypothetical protein
MGEVEARVLALPGTSGLLIFFALVVSIAAPRRRWPGMSGRGGGRGDFRAPLLPPSSSGFCFVRHVSELWGGPYLPLLLVNFIPRLALLLLSLMCLAWAVLPGRLMGISDGSDDMPTP